MTSIVYLEVSPALPIAAYYLNLPPVTKTLDLFYIHKGLYYLLQWH